MRKPKETGNNFFIVTEMNGKKLKDLGQRMLFISTADLKTGRRYIKGLEKLKLDNLNRWSTHNNLQEIGGSVLCRHICGVLHINIFGENPYLRKAENR